MPRCALAVVVVSSMLACSSSRPPWASRDDGGAGGSTAAAAGPALARELNLSFEDGDPPAGWMIRGPHRAAVADPAVAHAGARSLRIDANGEGQTFSSVAHTIPIERVRGRRVQVAAWFRSDHLDGELGLWLRADDAATGVGRPLAFGGSHAEPVTGTTDWVRREASVEVPAEAARFVLGAFVSGRGAAWIDDLDVVISGVPPPAGPVAIRGRVVDAAGAPAPGAVVAAVGPRQIMPRAVVTAGDGGRFALEVPAGSWAFTATSAAGAAAYAGVREVAAPADIELQLTDGGLTVRGTARVTGPRPAALRLVATRISKLEGDIFVADVGPGGEVAVRLPAADGYELRLAGDGLLGQPRDIDGDDDATVELEGVVPTPAPDEVVAWLAGAASPLAGVDPALPTDDLRPLHAIVDGARIIALGEATHGTREFFQLKHRVLEDLVEREGVRWFAIEANQPEARTVDEYVTTGKGTAAEALAGLYFWTWDTEEVLALIEWMRAYDADPRHTEKVHFAGFDMQYTQVAWPSVTAYLARVDPTYAARLPARLAIFGDARAQERWTGLAAGERAALRADLAAVIARLDRERRGWSKRTGAEAWEVARQDARVVEQAVAMYEAGTGGFEARDRAMADNVDWLLARAGTGARVMVWAHNGHVARTSDTVTNLGELLRERHGVAYRPIGFVFADGGFQALAIGQGVRPFTVGPPPPTDVAAAFVRAGLSVALVDLRTAPAGPVADWLAAPAAMRETGAGFLDEQSLETPVRLSDRFDAVLFVAHTSAARPTPTGRR